ncbi:transmembrane protein 11, mitochondrial [Patella vulgata]|uniref:transmembrane protein 11, mitochondrial n=1 Tax=Patella vulgata TaxID=6465 RepID=UPI00217F7AD7|nr:transmembrane protein 11, mitochondrial [Patella vulgata]
MADYPHRGGGDAPEYKIIREIYEHEDAQEEFEYELDRALEAGIQTIIIEPTRLGDETSRWISVGNFLHKTSVLAGLGSLICGGTWPDRGYLFLPLGAVSVICAAVHTISWQTDPCSKYQVEGDIKKLPRLPLHSLTTSTPVVLVKKNDFRRKVLHTTVSLAAGAYCGSKIHKWYFQ